MENFFKQFSGADLDRLVKCIQAVRTEGLTLNKYAQAGINQSSGNVYIYSEDWVGCVYCSLGGNVAWSYSCAECGAEHDFDSERECKEYSQGHDGKCNSCWSAE